MPLATITFKPGINRESSQYAAGSSWYDCDKVRFRKGRPESIGGWTTYPTSTTFPTDEAAGDVTTSFRGVCRSLLDWGTAAGAKYLGIGTNLKMYVETGGAMSDITPVRATTAAGDVTFAATNGSGTLTVSDTSHGAAAGDYVKFSGAVTLGGLVTAAVINHEYEIDALVDGDSYTITAVNADQTAVTANASDTGNGGAGGIGAYQINTGTNAFLASVGYGVGTYGSSPWGGGGALTFAGQLRLYSQDSFGDDLIFNPRSGPVFYWDESAGTSARAVDVTTMTGASDAPVAALQVMVSPEDRHVICFGVNSIGTTAIDPLLVRWSAQENAVDWTPTSTNSAGGQVLSTGTTFVGAVQTRQEVLIFTDKSIYSMRFSGAPFVFRFTKISENVTVLSPAAMVATGDAVFFMDLQGFYVFQGSINRIECNVLDYVFSNIDREQLFKVYATNNPDNSEVSWFYPTSSGEVDSYVTYNYVEQHWAIGTFDRGVWIQAPTKTNPVASSNDLANVKTNYLYTHENGYDADGAALGAYIESGGTSLDDGEFFMFMDRFLPDFEIKGTTNNADFTVKIKGTRYPLESPATLSTSTVTAATTQSSVRARARDIILRIESNGTGYGWTMGTFRFDLRSDGRR